MKLQDLRVGLRLLIKDPVYSTVAILGLGVGLAVCLMLLGFARYSWNYDAHVPDADHVYIIKHRKNFEMRTPWYDQAPVLLREAARSMPGVAAASGYLTWFPITATIDGQARKLRNLTVLPDFAEMMGLQAVEGDLDQALSRPDSFAITQAAAIRLFGTTDVMGRPVLLTTVDDGQRTNKGTDVARIAAIIRDPPANTTIPFEMLNGVSLNIIPDWLRDEALHGAFGFPGHLLIRLRPDASAPDITSGLQSALDRAPFLQKLPPEVKDRLAGRKFMDIRVTRLRDAYFDREVASDRFSLQVERGDPDTLKGLVAIAFLILTLAAINYVNLATVRVIRRQREIAMRKVLGARPGRLVQQFIAESMLVSLLATAIGILLTWLCLPLFGDLVDRDLTNVLSPAMVAAAVILGAALGILTAIYPAWIAFGVRPSRVLVGRPNTESVHSRRLRQALSVLQVAVTMGLASYALTVYWQTRFAVDASLGFDPSPLLVFELPDAITGTVNEHARNFRAALSQHSDIAGTAMSNDPIGRTRNPWNTEVKREGGPGTTMNVKAVGASFFEQYGIQPVAGRLFNSATDKEQDEIPLVIDAMAARQLGFASPELAVGQTVLFKNTVANRPPVSAKRIVGIAPDIRFYSLREPPRPIAYELWPSQVVVTARARGSVASAERAVRTLWAQYFPNAELDLSSAKDIYAANYVQDARLARLLAVSTIITMIIAAFGSYVLAADAVQRRTGEIALRKLFGARRRDVVRLVAKEMALIVLLSALVALPVAALAIARYLSAYTEHTPLAYWTLALAAAAAAAIVTLAAARQTWTAMMMKPAVALRG